MEWLAGVRPCNRPADHRRRAAGRHPTAHGKFEDCYYDCNARRATASRKPGHADRPQRPSRRQARRPAGEKAAALREAADLLDKAGAALASGNKNLAEQLFSTAELLVGPDALASLAPQFREGAPPRVTTPTDEGRHHARRRSRKVVGSSEAEDEEAKVPPPPQVEGSLTGTLQIDGKPLSGAFGLVTLEPASGKWKPRTPKQRVIEQRGREFLPHVMAIPVGSTVAFPNFDTVFHNVFSTSPLGAFDLGIYKAGEAREFTFTKEGIIRLGCNLHANMSAYIAVVVGAGVRRHRRQGRLRVQAPRARQVQAQGVERAQQDADHAGRHDQGRRERGERRRRGRCAGRPAARQVRRQAWLEPRSSRSARCSSSAAAPRSATRVTRKPTGGMTPQSDARDELARSAARRRHQGRARDRRRSAPSTLVEIRPVQRRRRDRRRRPRRDMLGHGELKFDAASPAR